MTNRTCPKPTTQQLAMIVAQLLPSCEKDLPKAAAEAVSVWEASHAEIAKWQQRIEEQRRESSDLESFQEAIASMDSMSPMSFDKMLKRLMPTIKAEDRTAKFRSYLSHVTGFERSEAGEQLGRYRKRQFTEFQFIRIKKAFGEWKRNYISKVRSEAGRQGGRPKNN